MNDPKSHKPPRPVSTPAPREDTGELPTGKVVHDDRGNAVWDWMKSTGRHAIESTSRLLRKLELPELKFEDPKDEELRIMPDPSTGGGYDPYNQSTKPTRKVLKK